MSPTFSALPKNEDSDLTRHFKSLELKKKRNRRRYVKNPFIAWGAVGLVILTTYLGYVYNSGPVLSYGIGVSALGSLLVGITTPGMLEDIYNPLNPVDTAFVKVYKALEALELGKKESKADDGQDLEVQQDAYSLLYSGLGALNSDDGKTALVEESSKLVKILLDELDTRLLPAAEEGKLRPETIEKLANYLASPTMEGLKTFKSQLESEYQPKETQEISIRKTASQFFGTRMGQVVGAFLSGFGGTIIISIVLAVGTGQNPTVFVRDNSVAILGVGAVISVGLLQFMKK